MECREETVYNFEVEDFHTYFVGEIGVWVHNNDDSYNKALLFSTTNLSNARPDGAKKINEGIDNVADYYDEQCGGWKSALCAIDVVFLKGRGSGLRKGVASAITKIASKIKPVNHMIKNSDVEYDSVNRELSIRYNDIVSVGVSHNRTSDDINGFIGIDRKGAAKVGLKVDSSGNVSSVMKIHQLRTGVNASSKDGMEIDFRLKQGINLKINPQLANDKNPDFFIERKTGVGNKYKLGVESYYDEERKMSTYKPRPPW